jgi:hypothetical protein
MSRTRSCQIRFTNYVRRLRDDELPVTETFKNHTGHCTRCFKTSCVRGQAYTKDVANYVYLDAGRPYSIIDQKADFADVVLDIEPSLFEAVQRALEVAQLPPGSSFRTHYEAPKRLGPRTYEIVEFLLEDSPRGEKPKRETRERRYFAN